jgi:hypothetical protein
MNLPDFQKYRIPDHKPGNAGRISREIPARCLYCILSFHPGISGSVAGIPINPMMSGIPVPGVNNRLNGSRERERFRVSVKKA